MSRALQSLWVTVGVAVSLVVAPWSCLTAQDPALPQPASQPAAESPVASQLSESGPALPETVVQEVVPVVVESAPRSSAEAASLVVENATSAAVTARIRQALDRAVQVDFSEALLRDVMGYLQESCQVPIHIDTRALDDVGLGSDTPVTISVNGISLRSLLDLMLSQLELTYTVRDEMLKITTPVQAESELEVRVYPVSDLAVEPPPSLVTLERDGRYDILRKLIADCLAPESWERVGGSGTAWVYEPWGILVVSQSHEIHEQLEMLLAALRKTRAMAAGNRASSVGCRPVAAIPVAFAQAQERIEQALDSKVTFAFEETPLSEVADFVAADRGIPVWIDRKALDDIGLGSDTPVSLLVLDVTLRSALQLLCRQSQLDFAVQHEVLVISTTEKLERDCVTKVYSLADFVDEFDTLPGGARVGEALESWRQLIESTIDVDSWEGVGGPGSLSTVPAWKLLIVLQREKVHAQIEALLQTTRQARKSTEPNEMAAGGTMDPVATVEPPVPAAVVTPGDSPVVAQTLVIPGPIAAPSAVLVPLTLQPIMVLKVYAVPDFESKQLAQAIRGTVVPESWTNALHGPAIFTVGTNLLIRQTEAGHAQIEQLIQGLRPRKSGAIPR